MPSSLAFYPAIFIPKNLFFIGREIQGVFRFV
jgi:hypothetical protein